MQHCNSHIFLLHSTKRTVSHTYYIYLCIGLTGENWPNQNSSYNFDSMIFKSIWKTRIRNALIWKLFWHMSTFVHSILFVIHTFWDMSLFVFFHGREKSYLKRLEPDFKQSMDFQSGVFTFCCIKHIICNERLCEYFYLNIYKNLPQVRTGQSGN